MRKFYSRALLGALVGGGLAVLGCGIANAAETSGADGLLSGDQAGISVDLPVTVGGNAVSLIGDSHSEDADTSAPAPDAAPVTTTDGGDGVASGNQGIISIDVPVTVGGNAVSVIGDSHSEDADTSAPAPAPEPAPEPETAPEQPPLHVMPVYTDEVPAPADSATTDGTDSVAGGNQVVAPVEVPVTIGGNAVSVIGDSHTEDATTTGGTTGTSNGSTGDVETDGTDSLLGGNQAIIP
ncbi:chaplin family protein, partial [Microbacterium hydrothermale]|uniref:chaplin family protein n=1 Tax=Microbacterium hydrothermale TaxID=857427 RepID=UPI0010A8E615